MLSVREAWVVKKLQTPLFVGRVTIILEFQWIIIANLSQPTQPLQKIKTFMI